MKIKKILAVLSASTIVCSTTLNSFPESDFLLDSLRAFAAELSPPYALTDGDSSSAAKTADELHTTDGWYYSLKDEQITITGYDGAETAIMIPDSIEKKKVVAVGDSAFKGNKTITSVDLGDVVTLGAIIFDGCTGLTEVTIPKSVKSTGNQFDGCLQGSSVEKVVFEEGIENIPENICFNARNVKEVVIPEKADVTDGYSIGDRAFRGTALATVILPDSLTSIGDSAFRDCAYLTEITIPGNVNTMEAHVFDGCKRLKELTIPKSVKSTGNQFDGCLQGSSIEKVVFEEGIEN
ncbi:Leucine rich repeat-containing protein, partial [Ruminococcus sp. YRD2003]|uniref:leucine-rich repeat domain-containing protein n=1 Tax=Ruminococcus sp. YRD2003 TaxID=1452313 RepID=UPI0008CBBE98